QQAPAPPPLPTGDASDRGDVRPPPPPRPRGDVTWAGWRRRSGVAVSSPLPGSERLSVCERPEGHTVPGWAWLRAHRNVSLKMAQRETVLHLFAGGPHPVALGYRLEDGLRVAG
ncbi:hypothetical protein chiPu_0029564, partial [Chiloscyllium punctatum]|nr:hypothetical protein [Chiloscyllium punctatum]